MDLRSRLGLKLNVRFDSLCEYTPAVADAPYVTGQACATDITLDVYVPEDPNAFDDGDTPDPPYVYDPTRQCEYEYAHDANTFVAACVRALLPRSPTPTVSTHVYARAHAILSSALSIFTNWQSNVATNVIVIARQRLVRGAPSWIVTYTSGPHHES